MTEELLVGPDSVGRRLRIRDGILVAVEEHPQGSTKAGVFFEPGRVNAHTHIYSGLAPLGMPAPAEPPKSFLEILEKVWWRLDRALDGPSLLACARLYVAEALLAGTVTLVDHHESPSFIEGSLDVLADACEELGIRALLCFGATERNGGRREAQRGLGECRRFLTGKSRRGIRGLVGLHASFTVSDETVREAGALCRETSSVLHVHLAEDRADVEDARRRGFEGPLERLLELDALPAGSILAHGVHCRRDQVELAAERGLWIVQNPRSNRGNGVGYPLALDASPKVGVGTDGYPSVLEDERAVLREEARAHGESPAEVARRMRGGWGLVGECFGESFDPLRPGSVADLVVRADGRIEQVWVRGRKVVDEGRLVFGDLEAIRSDAARVAPELWQRMLNLP